MVGVAGGWRRSEKKERGNAVELEDEDEDGASGEGWCGCAVKPERWWWGEGGQRCEDSSFPGWV